jgi:hypothetical protein
MQIAQLANTGRFGLLQAQDRSVDSVAPAQQSLCQMFSHRRCGAMSFAAQRILRRDGTSQRIGIVQANRPNTDVPKLAALRIFRVEESRFACFT